MLSSAMGGQVKPESSHQTSSAHSTHSTGRSGRSGRSDHSDHSSHSPVLMAHLLELARIEANEYQRNIKEANKQHGQYKKLGTTKDSGVYMDHRHPARLRIWNKAQESNNAAHMAQTKHKYLAHVVQTFKQKHPGRTVEHIEPLMPEPYGSRGSQTSPQITVDMSKEGTSRDPMGSARKRKTKREPGKDKKQRKE